MRLWDRKQRAGYPEWRNWGDPRGLIPGPRRVDPPFRTVTRARRFLIFCTIRAGFTSPTDPEDPDDPPCVLDPYVGPTPAMRAGTRTLGGGIWCTAGAACTEVGTSDVNALVNRSTVARDKSIAPATRSRSK